MKETAIQVSKSFNESETLNKDLSRKVLTLDDDDFEDQSKLKKKLTLPQQKDSSQYLNLEKYKSELVTGQQQKGLYDIDYQEDGEHSEGKNLDFIINDSNPKV